ncbi:MAG: MBL fold metallo-hydrolase [Methanolinea sp.]|nr:MBL fold metallo-hydrolase [Methanolinea sp.]
MIRPLSPLLPARWQPLPGAAGTRVYPFFGKPDCTSSNLCLVDTGTEFILVDSGTSERQLDEVVRLVGEVPGGASRPVILFITHCHVDHCYPLLAGSPLDSLSLIVAVQEEGAAAIATGDVHLTLGELFRKEVRPHAVHIPLLCRADREGGGERRLIVPGLGPVRLVMDIPAGHVSPPPPSQQVIFPSGTRVLVFHTPGHTPDSTCIRIGDVLFCGDIIFATKPGVAGIRGFSRDDLLSSIQALQSIVDAGEVTVWYPGHGDPLATPAMAKTLHKLKKEALSLEDIHSFDLSRLEESRDHALDILDEAERLFAIIGGRLLSLSFLLESLGEDAEAEKFRKVMDIAGIDTVLCDFQQFCADVRAGKRVEIQLVMKAVQVLQKLQRSISYEEVSCAVDNSIIWRAGRLLDEFLATSRDIPRDPTPDAVDLGPLLESLVTTAHCPPVSDEEFIAAADDPEAFGRALVARLAFLPPFPLLSLALDRECVGIPPVASDRFRLTDGLMALLEDLEAAGCRDARLGACQRENAVKLVVEAGCPGGKGIFSPRLIRRHARRFQLCGGEFSASPGGDRITCTVSFAAAR